jgi:capsid protein
MSKLNPLTEAKRLNALARLELDTALRKKKLEVLQKYDATEHGSQRRQSKVELQDEDGLYPMQRRGLGVNIGRDLERNYAPVKGILHQFRMCVVGDKGKLQINAKDSATDAERQACKDWTDWFNQEWARDCDFRDDLHFSTVLQNVVTAPMREGDLLAVVDDGLIPESMGGKPGGTGKLLHWDSDQIVPLSQELLDASPFKGMQQENGIIRNQWGRILAYSTTGKRGLGVITDQADATIWTRENAKLVKNPWRVNQGRGIPTCLTSATNFIDLYEILAAELASAKRAAILAGYTKRKNTEMTPDTPGQGAEFLPENQGKTAEEIALEQAGSGEAPLNYENFEKLTGGMWEYIDSEDSIEMLKLDRPNVNLPAFTDAVLGTAGASFGLARAYTLLRADSSYTSFRGDMVLSWAGAFYPGQKWLERTYADRTAVKVLTWAQRVGVLPVKLPAGWERSISWQWPTMPHVDEAKEAGAEAQSLKNGTLDFSEALGPNWLQKFQAFARQLAEARKLQLPLSVFEQKSGGAAPSEDASGADDETDDNGKTKE